MEVTLKITPELSREVPAAPKRIKLRHILPSLVTVFAICAGLTSVRMSIDGYPAEALYLIILAVVLDGADGKIARFFDTTSPFGAELDTLADFFNFGIAPGILLYTTLYRFSPFESIGWLSCMILAVCCALRLARFNIALNEPAVSLRSRAYFTGVPAPALACLALMPLYLMQLGWTDLPDHGVAVSFYVIAVACLAVSTVPTFSIKHAAVKREWFTMLLIAAVVAVMCLVVFPWTTLVVANLMYLASLPVSFALARRDASEGRVDFPIAKNVR